MARDVDSWDDVLTLTPEVQQRAYDAWRWAQGLAPLPPELTEAGEEARTPYDRAADFAKHALPMAQDWQAHEAQQAAYDLGGRIGLALRDFANPASWDRRRASLVRTYAQVGIALETLIAEGDAAAAKDRVAPYPTAVAAHSIHSAAGQLRQATGEPGAD
jgi:hypothetical protein